MDAIGELISEAGERPLTTTEMTRMRRVGNAVVPPLLAALRRPGFVSRGYGDKKGSAVATALELLEPFDVPGLPGLFAEVFRGQNEIFRRNILRNLARSGRVAALPTLKAGLRDPEIDCRQWTLEGLRARSGTSSDSERFRREMFDAVAELLNDPESQVGHLLPRVLLALDRPRAIALLLGSEVFRADFRDLHHVLDALQEAHIEVPADALRSLLQDRAPKAVDYPWDRAYGYALILLARAEAVGALDVIDDALAWGTKDLAESAAEAKGVAVGAGAARQVAWERYERTGVAGLTGPQRDYVTLDSLDAEVRNGSFSQYFVNSFSSLAGYAVAAAENVGAPNAARVIAQAISLFGPDGPSPDRDLRQDQLATLSSERLDELTNAYYDCGDVMGVLLPLYTARHATHFKRALG